MMAWYLFFYSVNGASELFKILMNYHFCGVYFKFDISMSFITVFIKSPRYTGGDFMFLYRFVRRRRRPAADSCSRDNF